MSRRVSEDDIETVLTYLDQYWSERKSPPTMRELAVLIGWDTQQARVWATLHVAAARGLVYMGRASAKQRPVFIPLWVVHAIEKAQADHV